ncbi:MAG TPA: xanthine dehydrogenase family protein molybdopterin-binding subunit [Anaerolineales bacterium]|nr:xanthine dehydrogenase family protein molybdopterin-binding subunit [Anaerolineales bacterium]
MAVGQSIRRIDALGKVTGETLFPGDIYPPNALAMKILFAGRPHAIVRRLDTSRAESSPGVVAVFTARDVPVNEYGLIMPDQPVLCGPGSAKPFADRVRFVGDQLALVVAEDEAAAARALGEIVVEFEDLPGVTDLESALAAGASLLHPERDSNIFCHYRIRRGDAQAALAAADVVVQREYRTPVQEHAFLQPEAGVSYLDEQGRVTVEVAGQWTHEDQEQIAHALGLPLEQVRVIYPAIGGAFGGREDMSVQIVLALAVWRLSQRGIQRPVRIVWSREESIVGHHKRHAYTIRSKWGATREGRLVAADVEILQDGGAYAYTSTKVLGNSTLLCTGPYRIPHVTVDAYSVYTNNIPGGAFRGFGGPQAAFSAEIQMNLLAEALGMDPVEIRRRNLLGEGDLLSVGTPLPKGVSIDRVVDACAEAVGWKRADGRLARPGRDRLGTPSSASARRGLGFACGFKNVGFSFGAPEQAWATVELHGHETIERAVVHQAGADCGQGAHTVMMQMAAQALDLPLERIELIVSDTARTDNSGSASASRMTFMAGNAIRGAAEQALAKWRQEERPAVGVYQYRPPATTPFDPQTGKAEPNFAYGYVAEAVSVEVDRETGQVRLLDVVCADDVGRAVNPQLVEGQIEGAVVQAAGYALLENFIQEGGVVRTAHLSTYLIPTVLDIPERVQSLILEHPDPIGPWGARGMGEMPYLPFVPAVAAAVHDAIGVWFTEFPLTPERVLSGLRAAGVR